MSTALKTSASGFASTPAIVTTVPNTLVVSLCSRPNDSATASFSITNVDLTAVVERFEAGSTQGDGGGFGLWSGLRAVPGAVGVSGGFQNTVTTNCAYTLALPPERRATRLS
ncbi:MAG: hypothetical protein R6W06_05085 [Prochlorococcaceae cyanobacterium]